LSDKKNGTSMAPMPPKRKKNPFPSGGKKERGGRILTWGGKVADPSEKKSERGP